MPLPIFLGLLLLLCLFAPGKQALAQDGCTDPQALNYEATAQQNDGSCLYNFTEYRPDQVAPLTEELRESSGLIWIDGQLYSHSDEGIARIYRISPTLGIIEQNITLLGATHVNWEDLAEGPDYLYLGDFGNNSGNREDLVVYRIAKADLGNNAVFTEKIEFTFSDQDRFDHQANSHDFDCEALLFLNGSLHLFSKNWLDGQTRHYVLDPTPGERVAELRDSFMFGGLVTAADVGEGGVIALLGRAFTGSLFCWLLFDYPTDELFKGNRRRIFLGQEDELGQMEALAFRGNGELYLSNEEKNAIPARLYRFPTQQWTGITSGTSTVVKPLETYAFPNPGTGHLFIPTTHFSSAALQIQVYDSRGQLCHSEWQRPNGTPLEIDLDHLSPGLYQLHLIQDAQSFSQSIIRTP